MTEKRFLKKMLKWVCFGVAAGVLWYILSPICYPRIYPYLVAASGKGSEVKYGECKTDGGINVALEDYLRARFQNSHSEQAKGKLFCDSVILWENDINDNEKVVFAKAGCWDVVLRDKDLREDYSNGYEVLYKLKKQDGAWQVLDLDDRDTPTAGLKDWVKENLALMPDTIYGNCDTAALWQKNLKKIGDDLGVKTSQYASNYCFNNSECASGETCYFRKLLDPYGVQNRCVKKCANHSECGAGYACKRQCLYGENGCLRTAVAVCVEDLIYPEFDKNNEPPL